MPHNNFKFCTNDTQDKSCHSWVQEVKEQGLLDWILDKRVEEDNRPRAPNEAHNETPWLVHIMIETVPSN